jgi:transcriptional regulator with XRE-family HTH domain
MMLALKNEGLSQREIAERLGLTKRQVEHVLRRWRGHVTGQG